MIPFVDLRRQYSALRGRVDAAIAAVLDRGWFILGEEVQKFEEEFAVYCGVSHGVGVASGTEALYVALAALGVGPGDEVVSVPNVSVPTVCAIALTGARPVLADVEARSRNLDLDRLAAAITPRTKAIVPVHLYGHPADIDAIAAMVADRGIAVVEDAAQAHGGAIRNRRTGSLGRIACFSFYPTKNLGAAGDGGMVLTNDDDLAERCRLVRDYGQKPRYHSAMFGINSRLDELQAAILRVKLPRLDAWNQRRRDIAARYRAGLAGCRCVLPAEEAGRHAVYHLFVVEVDDRNAFRRALESRGVQTAVHYPAPVHLQPAYAYLGYRQGDFPVSEALCRSVVSLPMFPELTDGEVDVVISAVRDAC